MIHFNKATQTFNLILRSSFLAFQVEEDGRLTHLGSGPLSPGGPNAIASGTLPGDVLPRAGLDRQGRKDEVLTFGDHTYHEVTLKVAFPTLPRELQPGEAPHLPIRDLRLCYAGHQVVSDAAPGYAPTHGRPTLVDAPRQTLRVRLEDPVQPFRVDACFRLTPEHDVIERWLELENTGTETVCVEQLFSGSLHLPNGRWELTYAAGMWAAEFTQDRARLPVGTTVLESRTIRTGFGPHPFFLLNQRGQAWEHSGTVWFGQLAFSGNWRLAFEQRPNGAFAVHGGYNPFDFELELAPGERHATPAFIHGTCAEGWDGASRRMQAFVRERVLPRTDPPEDVRPVLYNSWEATYFELSPHSQMELARQAAALGVELFCVDDGWFGARRSDRAGLGDWTVSPDVFPDGLGPLIREVHRLGMRFGLWVEPEMVNADSDLYRAHPDWVLHFAGRPRTEERFQLLLDFGRPEVLEHVYRALAALLSEYRIDFLKWDMNRSATEPGSVVGKEIWRAHTRGVYSIMDRLRREWPGLAIESCSSGGGRIDAGVLGRTDQAWTSDNTDALARVGIQEGYSLAYPARAMSCWVTHEQSHQTRRRLSVAVRFDVAMRGVLGIGSDLNALGEEEREEYARFISFYKRFRHVVQNGEAYRLQRVEEGGSSIVQYVSPDAREAVVSVVAVERRVAQVIAPARLRGLRPELTYVALDRDDREYCRATGAELMSLGLEPNLGLGHLGPAYSRTLHLRAGDD